MISAPGFEAILDGGGVFSDDADIEHGGATLTGDGVANQRESSPNVRLLDGGKLNLAEMHFSSFALKTDRALSCD